MSEYGIIIFTDEGEDIHDDPISLSNYLGGNKNPSELLDEISKKIDKFEEEIDDDEDTD